MPRCVTNWEQRTVVAVGKAMHIHKTVGGTATVFSLFSHSFSIYIVLSLSPSLSRLTYTTINTHAKFTRDAVSSREERTLNLKERSPLSPFSSLIVKRQLRHELHVWFILLTNFFDNKIKNLLQIIIFYCRFFQEI